MKRISKTIGECLQKQARDDGERTAMEMDSWSCSFKQLDRVSDLLAIQMKEFGIRKNTHVGIWSVNTPNWVFTFLALVKIGAVPVLINTCLKDEEVTGLLNYADVEVLYYGAGYKTILYEDLVARIRKRAPKVRHFLHIDEQEAGTWMSERSFGRKATSPEALEELEKRKKQVGPDDVACMIFTSGTTLLPKGVLLSHYSLVNNARAMVEAMHWGRDDRMCITVPMFHCFGMTAGILSCILSGAVMCLLPYFKTASVWDAVGNKHCTILNGVPSMFLAMIRKPEFRNRRAPDLRSGIIAGSPITPKEYLEICARFPGVHFQPSYGQTETSPCVTIADWDEPVEQKSKSSGRRISFVDVRIADTACGCVLKAGETGEIQVRGYNVMCSYYKLPKANAAVFTPDGWLRTGDLGYFDENAELHVTGRRKEMIIRGGENISPLEVEQAIGQLGWVERVKVVGVPTDVLQEQVTACIIPQKGCEIDKDGLLNFLKPRLAHYKVPAYLLKFDSFPTCASGKVNLKALKAEAAKRVKEGKSL